MIGKIIKELREEKRLTQSELAELMGININTLATYERETREPNIEKICLFADFFGVPTDYLFGKTKQRKLDIGVQGASELTGLSEASVTLLHDLNGLPDGENTLKVLNLLIEHELLQPNDGLDERAYVLSTIGKYLFYSPDPELEDLYSKWKMVAQSKGVGGPAGDGMQTLKKDLRATALDAVDKFISLESGDLFGDSN